MATARPTELAALRDALALLQARELSPFDLLAYATALDAVDRLPEEVEAHIEAEMDADLSIADVLQLMHDEDTEDDAAVVLVDDLYTRARYMLDTHGLAPAPAPSVDEPADER